MSTATAERGSPTEGVAALESPHEIAAVVRLCRRRVARRALIAAGIAAVPIPGVDWITDIATLMTLISEINHAFGLSPEQIDRLAPDRRLMVYKTMSAAGGILVGRLVTREMVAALLKRVGVRITMQQAAKFVPIAGQAVSAVLTFSSLKRVCDQHIRQCAEVSRQLMLPSPASNGVGPR